ncbi:MAG TPA: hypothetical protein VG713_06375 [Pirellulales bacterium]|nr:hypothetical protein [Pirellulales bacterium]
MTVAKELRTATASLDDLKRLLDERPPTNAELWMYLNYFQSLGVRRPELAERLGIGYLYLNRLLYGSKPVTPQFVLRLRRALNEPITAKPQLPQRKYAGIRKPPAKLPKVGAARFRTLTYPKLVESLKKRKLDAADVWPVINYFRAHGFKGRQIAEWLGVSHSHMLNVIYATAEVTDQFAERVRRAVARPLPSPPAKPPQAPEQPPAKRGLPLPLHDDEPIPPGSGATLDEHLRAYLVDRDLEPKSVEEIQRAIRRLSHWLGRPATLGDLNDQLINRWLASLAAGEVTRWTQKGLRSRILCLWRHAFTYELVPKPPMRVRTVKLERRIPEAWTLQQLMKLIGVARRQRGTFRFTNVSRAAFWEAFIRTGYDTGLRLGDLLSLRRDQIGPDGVFTVVQRKTGDGIVCALWPETLAAIDATHAKGRALIFGDVIRRDFFQQSFRRLVQEAGLKGSPKWLRRTGATAIEKEHPGASTAFLGHRTTDLAMKHYIDKVQLQRNKPRPPRLTEENLQGGAA